MPWDNSFETVITLPSGATSGARVVIDGTADTIIVYRADNSIAVSIAAAAGTDAYGNAFPAGVYSFNDADGQAILVANGVLSLISTSEPNDPSTMLNQGPGLAEWYSGTNGLGTQDGVIATLLAGSPGHSTLDGNEPQLTLQDGKASSPVSLALSGAVVYTSDAGVRDTWQTPTLGSGWALGPQGGSFQSLQFRRDGFDNVVLSGVIHCTSATPSSTLFTLPSGYQPIAGHRPGITSNQGGTYAARSIEISTSGVVTVDPVPTVAGTDLYIYTFFPRGNLK